MSDVIDQAVRDRERAARRPAVPFRTGFVRLTVDESARIVKAAARRFRRHNAGLAASSRASSTPPSPPWRGER